MMAPVIWPIASGAVRSAARTSSRMSRPRASAAVTCRRRAPYGTGMNNQETDTLLVAKNLVEGLDDTATVVHYDQSN